MVQARLRQPLVFLIAELLQPVAAIRRRRGGPFPLVDHRGIRQDTTPCVLIEVQRDVRIQWLRKVNTSIESMQMLPLMHLHPRMHAKWQRSAVTDGG